MIDNDFLSDQLIRLGDMMGDGLHHESDGKWIVKEYNRIFNLLHPEFKKERRLRKIEFVNNSMAKLLETFVCGCGGKLKQSRSGSIVAYCTECNTRYKARVNKDRGVTTK